MLFTSSSALHVLREIATAEPSLRIQTRVRAYGSVDPLIRHRVRRRVTQAVARVVLNSDHANDEAHVHRRAYLEHARIPLGAPDDPSEVREAFAAHVASAGAPKGLGFRATFTAVFTCIFLGAGGYAAWKYIPRNFDELAVEVPATRDAYTRGGRPLPGSDAVRELFRRDFAHFSMSLDGLRALHESNDPSLSARSETVKQERRAITARASEALGADAASFVQAFLEQSTSIVLAEPGVPPPVDSFIRSVDALNETLESSALGLYVDARVSTNLRTGQSRVFASTYTIEHVALYRSGTTPVRAFHARRLDNLNFERNALGFTGDKIRDALVLLDQSEEWIVTQVLPSLSPDASTPLADVETRQRNPAWLAPLEKAAGRAVRGSVRNLGVDPEDLDAIGGAVVERAAMLTTWGDRLVAQNIVIPIPRTYATDPDAYERIRSSIPPTEWNRFTSAVDTLGSRDGQHAYQALTRGVLRSTERHEVQHRLDIANHGLETMPAALETVVGPLMRDGEPRPRAVHALAELRAYLSELARDGELAPLALVMLGEYLFNTRLHGTTECIVALVIVEALATELRIAFEPLVEGRTINRERTAVLFEALLSRGATQLNGAASRAWQTLFAAPLPPLTSVSGG